MSLSRTGLGVLVLGFSAYALAQAPTAKSTPTHATQTKSKSAAKKKVVAPAPAPAPAPPVVVQEDPPIPLRPSQMPAVAPRISYQNGLLTVVAENSTMADIISGIRTATGIMTETPNSLKNERVAAKVGPAPVRDVLLSLFHGLPYDFFILGSATQPDQVERLIMTPKMGAAGSSSSGSTSSAKDGNPVFGNTYQPAVTSQSDNDNDNDNEGFAPAGIAPPAPPPLPTSINPTALPPGQQTPKTPEQLLQELRQMEQQKNQQPAPRERPPRTPN